VAPEAGHLVPRLFFNQLDHPLYRSYHLGIMEDLNLIDQDEKFDKERKKEEEWIKDSNWMGYRFEIVRIQRVIERNIQSL
jgi:hypothetical protein